jgi:hypothetical protein
LLIAASKPARLLLIPDFPSDGPEAAAAAAALELLGQPQGAGDAAAAAFA